MRWGKRVYHSGCFLALLSGRAILTVFMLAKQKVIFINKWFVDENCWSGYFIVPGCPVSIRFRIVTTVMTGIYGNIWTEENCKDI